MKKIINNKKALSLLLTLLMILLIVLIFGLGYAKYTSTASGTASGQIAKVICTMNIQTSDSEATPPVNPYCIITIKDYEGTTAQTATRVTEIDTAYTVTVLSADENVALPEYYWENMTTHEISHTANLQGTFTKGQAENQQYKIVFLNTNTSVANLQKSLNFEIVASQLRQQ